MTPTHKRHNFTQSVIQQMRDAVANLCSQPDCRVLTVAAKLDNESNKANVGVAAHICAAAPGGPRYDGNQTEAQRKNINNGIWLCYNCSRLIDIDEDAYPVEVLHKWKQEAQLLARQSLGKSLLPKDEIDKQAIKSFGDYIAGSNPISNLDAPAKVIQHFDNQLNNLDDNFEIRTDIVDGIATRQIIPRTDKASFNFTMNETEGIIFQEKLKNLREKGEPISFSSESMKLTGSKVLEALNGGTPSHISITASSSKVYIDLYAISKTEKLFLGSFKGKQYILENAIKFEGFVFNKLIKVTCFYNVTTKEMTCSYKLDISNWNSKSIFNLPFFNKILLAKDVLLNEGWLSIGLELEDGISIDALAVGKLKKEELYHFLEFGKILNIVHCYRLISKKYDLAEPIFDDFELSDFDYNNLTYLTEELLHGEQYATGENIACYEGTINKQYSDSLYESIEKYGTENVDDVVFKQRHGIPVLFGTDLSFLQVETRFDHIDLTVEEVTDGLNVKTSPNENSISVTRLVKNELK
ncbi:hypothetical protein BCU71_06300 [Vibrio lentus]|uniref:hypothetical protein n=1 Tax=Vibrio lentus TaxID=136468 RepID=UPI000C83566A|nr:hypothetical protein [Vibrio lentus]PMH28178.1 hypothetical protein BCU71_06300 [Vibrio lentus]PMK70160.1 hypothetical protein BCT93_05935 [Vibrio lentus]